MTTEANQAPLLPAFGVGAALSNPFTAPATPAAKKSATEAAPAKARANGEGGDSATSPTTGAETASAPTQNRTRPGIAAPLFQAPQLPVRDSSRQDRDERDENQDDDSATNRSGRGGRGSRRRGSGNDGEEPRSRRRQDRGERGEQREDETDQETKGGTETGPKRGRRGQASGRGAEAEGETQTDRSNSEDEPQESGRSRRTRRRASSADSDVSTSSGADSDDDAEERESGSSRRRRRRRRPSGDDDRDVMDEVTALEGSTRLEAKRQRRREGRREGRKPTIITEAEFLARRESVNRQMIVSEADGLNQIAVLEDAMLVEHYVARHTQSTMVGSIYLGRVQNVLPSMEAAFVDLGVGRNAVLYAGEVNWDAVGLQAGKPRRIEAALKSGDTVLVQVTKDPIGHKGARLTSQITLAGRYLVMVPGGSMTGISRKLPEKERRRLKKVLRKVVPKGNGVIVRTAAEGATEEQLEADVKRLMTQWEQVQEKSKSNKGAPKRLRGEPELALRVVRDIFNEDFQALHIQGRESYAMIHDYLEELSPDLLDRVHHWTREEDIFAAHRIDEQLTKGMDRKVWLPSGGYLIIDRTEAMTVIDVNTGRFTGSGGTLEETVTRNNLESAEEIARQLRLRDIGGIIVIDFVDMVLESNRDLVLRRLVECLSRDRTRHQVTEVTSLGLVQMTRKRVGQGLVEAFSTQCEHCEGRGFIVHSHPIERGESTRDAQTEDKNRASKRSKAQAKNGAKAGGGNSSSSEVHAVTETKAEVRSTLAAIAAAARHEDDHPHAEADQPGTDGNQAEADQEASGRESERAESNGSEANSGKGRKDRGGRNGGRAKSGRSAQRSGRGNDRGRDGTRDGQADSPDGGGQPASPAVNEPSQSAPSQTSQAPKRGRRRAVSAPTGAESGSGTSAAIVVERSPEAAPAPVATPPASQAAAAQGGEAPARRTRRRAAVAAVHDPSANQN